MCIAMFRAACAMVLRRGEGMLRKVVACLSSGESEPPAPERAEADVWLEEWRVGCVATHTQV